MVTSSPDTPNKSQKEGLVTTVVGITVREMLRQNDIPCRIRLVCVPAVRTTGFDR